MKGFMLVQSKILTEIWKIGELPKKTCFYWWFTGFCSLKLKKNEIFYVETSKVRDFYACTIKNTD